MKIASKNTTEMIDEETRGFLGSTAIPLSLGHLAWLHLARSPFLLGGEVTKNDIAAAREILDMVDRHPLDATFATVLRTEILAAFRALEIIQPSRDRPSARPKSQYPQWGPEWLADIMASVATTCPGASPGEILWKMPAVQAFHLVAAAVRKNGGCTRRPEDHEAIKAALDRLNSGSTDEARSETTRSSLQDNAPVDTTTRHQD
ncbi:MAG: hypothetical protein IJJ26_09415 [Victivallales bacterium]|nr:hypothetical protein [Victivallales bacterium]